MHHTTCAVCVFSNNHLIIITNNYFCFISVFSVSQSWTTFTFPSKHLIRSMNQIIRWSEFCYSCHKYLFQGETTLIWAQGKVLKLGHTGGGRAENLPKISRENTIFLLLQICVNMEMFNIICWNKTMNDLESVWVFLKISSFINDSSFSYSVFQEFYKEL